MVNEGLRIVRSALPSLIPCIYAAGLNFKSHATEVKLPLPAYPIFTMKAASSVMRCEDCRGKSHHSPTSIIRIPKFLTQQPREVDYEGELAVVIGSSPVKNVTPDEVAASPGLIQGIACSLDITARKWQGKKGGNQWVFAKSFDTFCPIMSTVVAFEGTPLCRVVPDLEIVTSVNGEVRQREKFSNMIFSIAEIIGFLSQGITLMPGTVILSGTPAGVGYTRRQFNPITNKEDNAPEFLKHGDEVRCSISSVGEIACRVVEE